MNLGRAAAVVFAACAGCVDAEVRELPAFGDHRALIAVAVEGGRATAARAEVIEGGVDLPLLLPTDQAREVELDLLYYRTGLEELGFQEGALTFAGDERCTRPLPRADEMWSTRTRGENFEEWRREAQTPAAVAALRVPFDTTACPTFEAPRFDVRCGAPACPAFARQNGCALLVELGSCIVEDVTAILDRSGDLCMAESEAFGSCVPQPRPAEDIHASFACTGGAAGLCEIDVYRGPDPQRFEIRTVRLFDAPAYIDDRGLERPPLGYLSDLAVLADRVVVASYGGRAEAWNNCAPGEPGAVYFLDRETLDILGSAPIPGCVTQLAPDPLSDGFLAAFATFDLAHLAWFTKEGVMTASIAAQRTVHLDRYLPNSMAVDLDSLVAGIVFEIFREPTELFAVHLPTRTRHPSSGPLGSRTKELSWYDAGTFAALEDFENYILLIDLATGERRRGPGTSHTSAGVGQLVHTFGADRLILSMTGANSGVFTYGSIDAVDVSGRARPYEGRAQVWPIAVWPPEPSLVLAGITESEGERRAYLSLVDPSRPRFLPGMTRVGSAGTAVGRMRADGDRVWAPLTWTAEVIRISKP